MAGHETLSNGIVRFKGSTFELIQGMEKIFEVLWNHSFILLGRCHARFRLRVDLKRGFVFQSRRSLTGGPTV